MPRKSRNQIKSSFFHIMVQGINKEYIFNKKEEKIKYLKFIKQSEEQFNIKIIVYCVMDNHIHLLLKADLIEELTKFMHKVNTLYAMYYNQKYERVGYVYRDRYKSQIIFSKEQLYTCINYIHNNPVKAKICKYPYQYEYSSFNEFNKNIKEFEKDIEGNFIKNSPDKSELVFIEDEDELDTEIQETINEYLCQNEIVLEDLKRNREHLEKIAIIVKDNYKLSVRKMAMYLDVGRERLRYILKSCE